MIDAVPVVLAVPVTDAVPVVLAVPDAVPLFVLVDETGSIGLFHTEQTQIETGQMYFILVGDNRIARLSLIHI